MGPFAFRGIVSAAASAACPRRIPGPGRKARRHGRGQPEPPYRNWLAEIAEQVSIHTKFADQLLQQTN